MTVISHEELVGQFLKEAKENFEEVVQWRRHLHAHPELSFEEYETSSFIEKKLIEFGLDVTPHIGSTGIVARLDGAKSGKSIALRADFDALPIVDLKQVSYVSKNEGISHSCGHDGHTAALLGVAKVLVKYKEQLKGSILFVFQHAEEKPPGGAKEMLTHNILKDIDYVFAAHLDSSLQIGQIAVGEGFKMAAVDRFEITVKGQGGHGAKPHQTKDALVIGSEIVGSLQKIVSRQVDPLQSAVVTIGQFHAGTAFNVIAETAVIEGTVRTYDEDIRQMIHKSIQQIAQGIAGAFDVEVEIDYLFGYPALYNDPEQTAIVEQVLKVGLGEKAVVPIIPSMGAEDFAYFLKERPGTYFKVGSRNEKKETQYPHHHGNFDIDERALLEIQQAFIHIVGHYLI